MYLYFSACGAILNGSASGSLSSPNFPALFPSGQTQGCSWTIRVPNGRIKLVFHNFTLEEQGNSNCVGAQGARLSITNVASDDNQRNFALCGPKLPSPVYSTGNFMTLTLVSATNNVPGFNASYETITDEMCKCLKILMVRIIIMVVFVIKIKIKFLIMLRVLPSSLAVLGTGLQRQNSTRCHLTFRKKHKIKNNSNHMDFLCSPKNCSFFSNDLVT